MNRHSLPIDVTTERHIPAFDVRKQEPKYEAPSPVRPPDGAPNVLLILLDDVGFGASSAFGGPCRMPTAESLADNGARFSRFHTTALCSPTRAALLTGRNHHSVGMGGVPETATSSPGYNGLRPRSCATIAQTLSYNGYATGAFGKMHQTPPWEQTVAGPYDHWPTREGFDKFYGFVGAETNQFAPNLYDGTTPIETPGTEEDGYHLSEDLVDQAIRWTESVRTLDPGKPWFCYLSFGACHTPFHLPRDWRTRYRGEFSAGWDAQREITLARQKELGVVPQGASLGPWTPGVPHWDELDDDQKAVAERLMEAYAAFAEHTDEQVGRMIAELGARGELDNTLVFYILGDNGASAEGGLEGTMNEMAGVNGLHVTAADLVDRLDDVGGPMSYALYPAGWAVAMDTPYQWTKQVASHYGGTRNGMIVHWPEAVTRPGIRNQWHHCIDVAPTILEAAGLPEPTTVDGVAQRPYEGVSMMYCFDDESAPDRHTTQYFEMFGNRGIYHHGWTAVTKHRTPWTMAAIETVDFDDDVWELYDTNTDWSQAVNLADRYPDKLEDLKRLFIAEAARYQVFPLDDRLSERFDPLVAGRRTLMSGRTELTVRPGTDRLREDSVPNLKNTSFRITASIDSGSAAAHGVIAAQGGRFGGWALYCIHGQIIFCHNLCDVERYFVRSESVVPGRRKIEFVFDYDGGGVGKGGTGTLLVDGVRVGQGRVDRTVPYVFSVDEVLSIGRDRGTPVSEEYRVDESSVFGGTVEYVTFTTENGTDDVEQRLRATLATH